MITCLNERSRLRTVTPRDTSVTDDTVPRMYSQDTQDTQTPPMERIDVRDMTRDMTR